MVKIKKGRSITTCRVGIIVHQVNCQKMIGSGVSGAIISKWPHISKEFKNSPPELGGVLYHHTQEGIVVASVYGQNHYGREKGRVYTDYTALEKGLARVAQDYPHEVINIPWKIGCGTGGGQWERCVGIIERVFANHKVIIWNPAGSNNKKPKKPFSPEDGEGCDDLCARDYRDLVESHPFEDDSEGGQFPREIYDELPIQRKEKPTSANNPPELFELD